VKRTYQPNVRRRAKRHGFRHRMSDRAGRAVLRSRRLKGRHRLSAWSGGYVIARPWSTFVGPAPGSVLEPWSSPISRPRRRRGFHRGWRSPSGAGSGGLFSATGCAAGFGPLFVNSRPIRPVFPPAPTWSGSSPGLWAARMGSLW